MTRQTSRNSNNSAMSSKTANPSAILSKFKDIHELLLEVLMSSGAIAPLKPLQSALLRHKQDFIHLFAEPAQDPSVRQELVKGNIGSGGQRANKEFCQLAIALSDFLELNETRASLILTQALKEQARFGNKPLLEVAVQLYYTERDYLLDCLSVLFSASTMHQVSEDVRAFFMTFLQDILSLGFVEKSLALVDRLKDQLKKSISFAENVSNNADASVSIDKPTASVSKDTADLRVSKLTAEVNSLGTILMSCASSFKFSLPELRLIQASLLKMESGDPVMLHFVLMFLTSLDGLVDLLPNANGPEFRNQFQRLVANQETYNSIKEWVHNASKQPYSIPDIGGLIELKWICYLEAVCHSPATPTELYDMAIQESDAIQKSWMNSYGNDAAFYRFMVESLIKNPILQGLEEDDVLGSHAFQILSHLVQESSLALKRYYRVMLSSNQDEVAAKIELRQEESGMNAAEMGVYLKSIQSPWEAMLAMIAAVYEGRADAAKSWFEPGSDLLHFLKMASDVRCHSFIVSFISLLSALCGGPISATRLFEILSVESPGPLGMVVWDTLFSTLHHYMESVSSNIAIQDSDLVSTFLNLLALVVEHSTLARRLLLENQSYRVIQTLFYLLVNAVPIEMKSILLRILSPLAKGNPESLCGIMGLLEQSQILDSSVLERQRSVSPTPMIAPDGSSFSQGSKYITAIGGGLLDARSQNLTGIVSDLANIEIPSQTFPETTAFLQLLLTIFEELQQYAELISRFQLRPLLLKYWQFTTQAVFLELDNFEFQKETESASLHSLCLDIFIQLLKLMDQTVSESTSASESSALHSVSGQPEPPIGTEWVKLLYSNTPLTRKILSLFTIPLAQLNEISAQGKERRKMIQQSLAILLMVFRLQPRLQSYEGMGAGSGGIDHQLAYHKDILIYILSLINCNASRDIIHGSIEVAKYCSVSAVFSSSQQSHGSNRLFSILDGSDLSEQIVYGYMDLLEADEQEEVFDPQFCGLSSKAFGLLYSSKLPIPLVILDFLLEGLMSDRAVFGISHFLLGFGGSFGMTRGGRKETPSCIQSLLALLSRESPLISSSGSLEQLSDFYAVRERAFRIILRLCKNRSSCAQVIRYLRSRDFFDKIALVEMNGLSLLQNEIQESSSHSPVASSKFSVMLEKCWILELFALEIHLSHIQNHPSAVRSLLKGIFATPKESMKQSGSHIREYLNLLEFPEVEEPPVQAPMVQNAHGAVVYYLGEDTSQSSLTQEIDVLLEWNLRQEWTYCNSLCLNSWIQLFRIILAHCYNTQLLSNERESLIMDIVTAAITKLGTVKFSELGTVLSSALFALQQDKAYQSISGNAESVLSHKSSLVDVVLRGIIEGIVSCNHADLRANFYSALLSYFSYIAPHDMNSLVSSLDSFKSLLADSLDIVSRPGKRLIDVIWKDALNGPDVSQCLAFNVLAMLMRVGCDSVGALEFLNGLICTGAYLKQSVETIAVQNQKLASSSADDQNVKYVLESKLDFILQLSSSSQGASILLSFGLADMLISKCECFSSGLNNLGFSDSASTNPSDDELFILSLSILTNLTPIKPAIVARSVVANASLFRNAMAGLRGPEDFSVAFLDRCRAVSAFIAGLAENEKAWSMLMKLERQQSIHQALLSILRRTLVFGIKTDVGHHSIVPSSPEEQQKEDCFSFVSQLFHQSLLQWECQLAVDAIWSAILGYLCQRFVFAAHVTAGHEEDWGLGPQERSEFFAYLVQRLGTVATELSQLQAKIANVHQLPLHEINELTGSVSGACELSLDQRRRWALTELSRAKDELCKVGLSLKGMLEKVSVLMWNEGGGGGGQKASLTKQPVKWQGELKESLSKLASILGSLDLDEIVSPSTMNRDDSSEGKHVVSFLPQVLAALS